MPSAESKTPIDHRSRVAAERRQRMRARLIESAMLVFAEKGVEASVIQEVVAVAEVSQGSFYNYFRSNEELLLAVSEELNNELVKMIETEVIAQPDPVRRIATGLRLYLRAAEDYPLLARFVTRAGLHVGGPSNLVYEYLPPHIEAGQAAGQLAELDMHVALDLLAGAALMGLARIASDEVPSGYAEQLVAGILCALGVSRARAAKEAARPVTPLQPGAEALLARGQARSDHVEAVRAGR